MKHVWILVGGVVVVAAGATLFIPSPTVQPTRTGMDTNDLASNESSGPTRMSTTEENLAHKLLPEQAIGASPEGRSTFAPVPSQREGLGPRSTRDRADPPKRTSEESERRAQNQGVNQPAKPVQAAKPVVPVTSTSTTGVSGAPGAVGARPVTPTAQSSTNPQAAATAALESRRQELERARRQRIADAQQRAALASQNSNTSQITNTTPGGSRNEGPGSDGLAANGPDSGNPLLDQIIRDNPWLADFAPGGALANSTGTSLGNIGGNGPTGTSNGSNSSNSGTSGSNGSGSSTSNSGTPGTPGSPTGPSNTTGSVGIVGGGGGGGSAAGPLTITHRWIPVDNRGCGSSLAGTRTNDLYLRLTSSAPVLSIDFAGENGLTVVGGQFRQQQGGSDDAPTAPSAGANACVQFDTYLNGGESYSVIPASTTAGVFPNNTGVDASLFSFTGVTPTQDPARFGDDGFYILVGRFTAPVTITNLSGRMNVGAGGTGANFREFPIEIPFDSTLWTFNAAFGSPPSTTGTPGTTPPGTTPPTTPPGTNPPSTSPPTTPPSGNPPSGNPPPTGGENPPPDDPCASDMSGLTAVWLPVDNGGCVDAENNVTLVGMRTADLYLRMKPVATAPNSPPFSVQYVAVIDLNSTGAPPLTVAGGNGRFHQDPTGGLFRPLATDVTELPCLAFDSYAALDTGATEAPEGAAPPAAVLPVSFTPTTLSGWWVVPDFVASSAVPAAREAVKFPNDTCGRFVRIGRFTITQGSSLTGTIYAGIVRLGRSSSEVVEVVVPNCATCWGQAGP